MWTEGWTSSQDRLQRRWLKRNDRKERKEKTVPLQGKIQGCWGRKAKRFSKASSIPADNAPPVWYQEYSLTRCVHMNILGAPMINRPPLPYECPGRLNVSVTRDLNIMGMKADTLHCERNNVSNATMVLLDRNFLFDNVAEIVLTSEFCLVHYGTLDEDNFVRLERQWLSSFNKGTFCSFYVRKARLFEYLCKTVCFSLNNIRRYLMLEVFLLSHFFRDLIRVVG